MDLGVRDKVYAIVGGTMGMGFATGKLLAEEGARVALIARTRELGEERARSIRDATGADVRMFVGDGSVAGSLEGAIGEVVSQFGRLDGLAVTAGKLQTRRTLLEVSDEEWEAYFQSHLMICVRACRAAVRHFVDSGRGGAIVNTASYSIRAEKPVLMGYVSMKTAIASLTRNIALTHGVNNVRANTICPGFTATDSLEKAKDVAAKKYGLPRDDALNRAMWEDYGMNVAMGRVATPAELADLFAFLLSSRAWYLTGATINVDGGVSAWKRSDDE